MSLPKFLEHDLSGLLLFLREAIISRIVHTRRRMKDLERDLNDPAGHEERVLEMERTFVELDAVTEGAQPTIETLKDLVHGSLVSSTMLEAERRQALEVAKEDLQTLDEFFSLVETALSTRNLDTLRYFLIQEIAEAHVGMERLEGVWRRHYAGRPARWLEKQRMKYGANLYFLRLVLTTIEAHQSE